MSYPSAIVQSCGVPVWLDYPGHVTLLNQPLWQRAGPTQTGWLLPPKTTREEGRSGCWATASLLNWNQHTNATSRVLFLIPAPAPICFIHSLIFIVFLPFPLLIDDHLQTTLYTCSRLPERPEQPRGGKVSPFGLIAQGQGRGSQEGLS